MYQASICTYYVEFRSKTTHSFLLSKGLADFRGKTTCIRYVSALTMGLADFRGKTTYIRYVFVLTIGLADFWGKTTFQTNTETNILSMRIGGPRSVQIQT